jgi:hypothetical protein
MTTATAVKGTIITLIAAALTVKNKLILPSGAICGAGAKAIGVSCDSVKENEALPVQIDAIAWVEVGSAVTVNTLIKSDAQGRAIPVTANTDVVNGIALDEATAAQQVIRIKIL